MENHTHPQQKSFPLQKQRILFRICFQMGLEFHSPGTSKTLSFTMSSHFSQHILTFITSSCKSKQGVQQIMSHHSNLLNEDRRLLARSRTQQIYTQLDEENNQRGSMISHRLLLFLLLFLFRRLLVFLVRLFVLYQLPPGSRWWRHPCRPPGSESENLDTQNTSAMSDKHSASLIIEAPFIIFSITLK